MIDTLLATWGLSLFLIGLVTTIFGPTTATTVSPPVGPVQIGAFSTSGYELLLIVLAATLMLGRYTGYRLTELPRFRVLAGIKSQ